VDRREVALHAEPIAEFREGGIWLRGVEFGQAPFVVGGEEARAPRAVVEAVSSMSVLTHFDSMVRGVLDARDLLYFISVMVAFLFMNALLIDWKKAL
jgi:ABC-2 type transport system permease protein